GGRNPGVTAAGRPGAARRCRGTNPDNSRGGHHFGASGTYVGSQPGQGEGIHRRGPSAAPGCVLSRAARGNSSVVGFSWQAGSELREAAGDVWDSRVSDAGSIGGNVPIFVGSASSPRPGRGRQLAH